MPELCTAAGAAAHVDAQGPEHGEPLLLIHGLGAQLVWWRDEFVDLLVAEGYRVIRFDSRDSGLAPRYPDQEYTLSDLADDTHELVADLGVGPVHVVGQSMGGMVAQVLAIEHPRDVLSLGLLSTTASWGHLMLRDGREDPDRVAETTRAEAIAAHLDRERFCASPGHPFDTEWETVLAGLMWDRGVDPEGVARQRRAVASLEITPEDLATVAVPTVLIHGAADPVISDGGSLQLHAAIPDSELWIVEGMGHDLPRALWPDIVSRLVANTRRGDPR